MRRNNNLGIYNVLVKWNNNNLVVRYQQYRPCDCYYLWKYHFLLILISVTVNGTVYSVPCKKIWNLMEKVPSPWLHQKFVSTNDSHIMKAEARSWVTDVCSVMEHLLHIQMPRPTTKSIAAFTCPLSVKSCNQILLLNGSGSTCHLLGRSGTRDS
jgi:hypothetical protein